MKYAAAVLSLFLVACVDGSPVEPEPCHVTKHYTAHASVDSLAVRVDLTKPDSVTTTGICWRAPRA